MSSILVKRISEGNDAVFSLIPPFPNNGMRIEITNICNHNCVFCANKKIKRDKKQIDESFLYHILNEAFDSGIQEVGFNMGGEPLVCSNFVEYVKVAKDIGYSYVFLTTNGSLATPDLLKNIVDAGLDSIKISINAGSREAYKAIHGKDDFDKVIENLKFCNDYRKESGKKYNIFVSFVVTNQTEHEIREFKDHVKDYTDEIAFYKVRSVAVEMPENKVFVGEFSKVERCVAPFNGIYVTCEGFLVPCCSDFNNNLVLGDLNVQSLKDIWYGERMTWLRQKLLNNDIEDIQCGACLQGGGGEVELIEF